MATTPEPVHVVLRRVDTSRRIVLLAIAALFVVILLMLGPMMAAARVDTGGRTKLEFVGIAAQMLFTGACAILVAFHVTRMTKTVLRAIELAKVGDRG